MKRSGAWLVLFACTPAFSGCFQALDSSISEGPVSGGSGNSGAASSGGSGSPAMPGPADGDSGTGGDAGSGGDGGTCQNGFTIDPMTAPILCTDNLNGGNQPIVTQTPGIELPDGSTTINPCDLLQLQSVDIRTKYCAACHGHPGLVNAPFHTIMDDQPPADGGSPALLTTTAAKLMDDSGAPALIVYPGDPDHSLLYLRVATQTMPPGASAFGQAGSATPNVSEMSLLRSWIQECLGGGAAAGGGGGSAPAADGGASGDDGGGSLDATVPVPVEAGPPPVDAGRRIRDAGGGG